MVEDRTQNVVAFALKLDTNSAQGIAGNKLRECFALGTLYAKEAHLEGRTPLLHHLNSTGL